MLIHSQIDFNFFTKKRLKGWNIFEEYVVNEAGFNSGTFLILSLKTQSFIQWDTKDR